jgi:hypothetical protein
MPNNYYFKKSNLVVKMIFKKTLGLMQYVNKKCDQMMIFIALK